MEIRFTIPGEPKGKGRPRFNRATGRSYTPSGTVEYENLVKLFFNQSCADKFPDDAQLKMHLDMYYSIPKSASKKKRIGMGSGAIRPTKKPDIDNILKAVADSLNGIAYKDDSQIVAVECFKYYSDEPRVEVLIKEV